MPTSNTSSLGAPDRSFADEVRFHNQSNLEELSEDPDESGRYTLGTPGIDARFHQPQQSEVSGIAVQRGVIAKHTGVDHDEQSLIEEAYRSGQTDAQGCIYPQRIGDLLEKHGIQTQCRMEGTASIGTIRGELARGHDVLVVVDMGELYRDAALLGRGHVVWVTGLIANQQEGVVSVAVNDPAKIGAPQQYPTQVFEDAWAARNRLMVSTRYRSPLL